MYDINIFAISISFLFLIVALIVIKKEELGIEKEVLIAGMLALIQLIILGFLIDTIFKLNIVFTFLMVVLMITVASIVITKNLKIKKNANQNLKYKMIAYTFISLFVISIISLSILGLSDIIEPKPKYIIPFIGIIIGNTTNGISLSLKGLVNEFKSNKDILYGYLLIGATNKQASKPFIKKSITSALIPQLNNLRTTGVIFIPGAMVGLLLGGMDPLYAATIQIIIMWMLASSSIIASVIACNLLQKTLIYYMESFEI
ncbi:MAG: iron export ABC transporter permease subunit FetB [Methanosarcinaceae archaeon]|nr:iron export ABC transporter permease subunit FetB [Methanosarcinaceae archaeon]